MELKSICTAEVVNRGMTIAYLEPQIFVAGVLVASVSGNHFIFTPGKSAT